MPIETIPKWFAESAPCRAVPYALPVSARAKQLTFRPPSQPGQAEYVYEIRGIRYEVGDEAFFLTSSRTQYMGPRIMLARFDSHLKLTYL